MGPGPIIFFTMAQQPQLAKVSSFSMIHDHTTLGRTPLDEWSARRRDLYPKTHNTHKRQTLMTPTGFEPIIPGSERPQNHALDSAATRIGSKNLVSLINQSIVKDIT